MSEGKDNPPKGGAKGKLSLNDHQPGVRLCLGRKCGRWFGSLGPGNRLCPKCSLGASRGGLSRREEGTLHSEGGK